MGSRVEAPRRPFKAVSVSLLGNARLIAEKYLICLRTSISNYPWNGRPVTKDLSGKIGSILESRASKSSTNGLLAKSCTVKEFLLSFCDRFIKVETFILKFKTSKFSFCISKF